MSHGYVPVQWNPNKLWYDRILALGVVLFIAVDVALIQSGGSHGKPADEMASMLRALGDAAFVLLNIILITGPLARLDDRFLPLLYNRRHMGVTMFALGLFHGLLALVWYHGFGAVDPITSLFTSQGSYEALADFPFQPLGFVALIIFFLMAATSHDYWNANLGAPVWKALHMVVYLAYALIILHIAAGALQAETSGFPAAAAYGSVLLVGGLHSFAGLKSAREGRAASLDATDWVPVGAPEDIPLGAAKIVIAGGERIAIFRTEDGTKIGAIGNACQHQNGPLGEGCMKDGLVTCPWHGFQYRLEDGCSPPPFTETVPTYHMKLADGVLLLDPTPLPDGTERPLVGLQAQGGQA